MATLSKFILKTDEVKGMFNNFHQNVENSEEPLLELIAAIKFKFSSAEVKLLIINIFNRCRTISSIYLMRGIVLRGRNA
jgi:hypothetical protein